MAKVFVTVVEAADLLASNANGKSDPFCVVKLGESQELATPIIMGTLNPRWNHTVSHVTSTHRLSLVNPFSPTQMEFIVTDMEEGIDFTVFDSDMFSPNGN